MTWAPITPNGFIARSAPSAVRRNVPSRFGVHLFAPLSNAAQAILIISLEVKGGNTIHASTIVTQDELGKDAATLYERFIMGATAALDERAKKRAA